jgi:ABC-type phosphate transport system substrate-binding protein
MRALLATVALLTLHAPAVTEVAPAHAQIEGSGSSWSANAVNQWIGDVDSQGLQVVFTPSGSAQGRKDYGFANVDFGVTDIPYQGHDPKTNESDSTTRPYAYLPVVAGGTSFPYQIKVGGKLVKDLRLSGLTLARIFTGAITKWNDPAITADNNGRVLPALSIIPVVHSEGSGSTAQFTSWMASQFPAMWTAYNRNPALTEYYPNRVPGMVLRNGSDGVMNFVAESSANGSIGYDEYSYALNKGYPVAKLQNKAGYFTLPTQYNVAVSLLQAQINLDKTSINYLIQKLDKVYVDPDPRTYPMSSYSYMILPTGTSDQDSRLTTPKRQTLVDFLYYAICSGQEEMGPIGYSPLPVNLVQAGFDQIQKLYDADHGVDITHRDVSTCHNPTFVFGHPNDNYLAQIAPQPLPCDRTGAGPCRFGETAPTPGPTSTGGPNNPTAHPTGTGGPGATPTPGSTVVIDPDTGQVVPGGNGGAGGGGDNGAQARSAELVDSRTGGLTGVLTPLILLELLAVLVVPVVLQRVLVGRRRDRS